MTPKTLEDLEALPGEVLTCQQIAPILGAKADNIHQQAVERPELLGFPVIVMKSRVKVPKRAFCAFMRNGIKE
jgi:hypothetical protein